MPNATIDPIGLISTATMSFAANAQPNTLITVQAGQEITVDGSAQHTTYDLSGGQPPFGAAAVLDITDPKDFKGTIVLKGQTQVTLLGQMADSYNISGDVLTLYEGNRVTDKITFDSSASFAVGAAGQDVVIISGRVPGIFPSLPLHT